ncbi:hypothetical protein EIL50_03850 [bacterium NHP-B]|nr:hypothetical protein EIL50_03850 [bacterium NHP-B]
MHQHRFKMVALCGVVFCFCMGAVMQPVYAPLPEEGSGGATSSLSPAMPASEGALRSDEGPDESKGESQPASATKKDVETRDVGFLQPAPPKEGEAATKAGDVSETFYLPGKIYEHNNILTIGEAADKEGATSVVDYFGMNLDYDVFEGEGHAPAPLSPAWIDRVYDQVVTKVMRQSSAWLIAEDWWDVSTLLATRKGKDAYVWQNTRTMNTNTPVNANIMRYKTRFQLMEGGEVTDLTFRPLDPVFDLVHLQFAALTCAGQKEADDHDFPLQGLGDREKKHYCVVTEDDKYQHVTAEIRFDAWALVPDSMLASPTPAVAPDKMPDKALEKSLDSALEKTPGAAYDPDSATAAFKPEPTIHWLKRSETGRLLDVATLPKDVPSPVRQSVGIRIVRNDHDQWPKEGGEPLYGNVKKGVQKALNAVRELF